MKILKEPFFHFAVIGLGFFILFAVVNDDTAPEDGSIVITEDRIDYLSEMFAKTWQRQPTPSELEGLIEDHLKEEVFYREALRLGLDSDDVIIRRRMRQKMEFVAQDASALIEPTAQDLEEYLSEHMEKFEFPPLYSFKHVYLDPKRHPGTLDQDVSALLTTLRNSPSRDILSLGDPLMLDRTFVKTAPFEITRYFGEEFSDRIQTLDQGQWLGPIPSGYGVHLVIIDEVIAGREAQLEEVLPEVEREFMNERRLEAMEYFYQQLKDRYDVVIERPVETSQENANSLND